MEERQGYDPEQANKEQFSSGDILSLLQDELNRMEARNFGEPRTDPKYVTLRDFLIVAKAGATFEDTYNHLSPHKKHAIVTRLENIEIHLTHQGDNKSARLFKEQVVLPLERQLYGTDEEGYINSGEKFRLEAELFGKESEKSSK